MSKSYNNAIYLSDTRDDISSKVSMMVTDPDRARKNDPGNPEICNVFSFHQMYSTEDTIKDINDQCRKANIGCVECKKIMAKNLIKFLEPIREKREYYASRPETVDEIIAAGNEKAKAVASQTMAEVRQAIKLI
jgi:tryptophanyl-tRNA synthetase